MGRFSCLLTQFSYRCTPYSSMIDSIKQTNGFLRDGNTNILRDGWHRHKSLAVLHRTIDYARHDIVAHDNIHFTPPSTTFNKIVCILVIDDVTWRCPPFSLRRPPQVHEHHFLALFCVLFSSLSLFYIHARYPVGLVVAAKSTRLRLFKYWKGLLEKGVGLITGSPVSTCNISIEN